MARKAIPQPGMSRKGRPAAKLPSPEPLSNSEIVAILEGYRQEAETNRRTGLNPRDDKWTENLNAYWNRHDFSQKADWQAKESMAEVPAYVDRFAAALKEALVASPEGFYTVKHPADKNGDLAASIKKMEDVWLSRCGRNASGDPLAFATVFEEQMKLGCWAACSAVVTWKEDVPDGRVAVESEDPRRVWLDHTYRGLYRIRRTEVDRHELARMGKLVDGNGDPIFRPEELARVTENILATEQRRAEELSGTGQQVISARTPVTLDEHYCDIIGRNGTLEHERVLCVVANQQFLIRGPEKNPFSHGRDWVLYAPLIPVPLSPYGRSYMEDFGSIARTFNELTNMILDAVHTASLNAFAIVPTMLAKPEQLAGGVTPNKTFFLEDGVDARQFMAHLELGRLPPEAVQIWQALKGELVETAKMNEIGLGQFAPKGRTSATEVERTLQSTSSLIRSVADTVENTFLNPLLELIWKTGLQHCKPTDQMLRDAAGDLMYDALLGQRAALVGRRLTFQAQGISRLIERSNTLKGLVQLLQIIASNDVLLQQFLQIVDVQKLVELLFELSNIDIRRLQATDREKLLRPPMEAMGAAASRVAGAAPTPGAAGAGSPIPGQAAQLIAALGGAGAAGAGRG